MDAYSSRTAWLQLDFSDVPYESARVMWATSEDDIEWKTQGVLIVDIGGHQYEYEGITNLWYEGIRMYKTLPDRAYRLLAAAAQSEPFLQQDTWASYEPVIDRSLSVKDSFDEGRFKPAAKSVLATATGTSPSSFEHDYRTPSTTGPATVMAALRHRGSWQMTTILDAFESLDEAVTDIEQEYINIRRDIRQDMMPFVADPLRLPHPEAASANIKRPRDGENSVTTYSG